MRINAGKLAAACIIAGMGIAAAFQGGAAIPNLLHNIGVGRMPQTEAIRVAIKQYNAAASGIYATGGLKEELAVIPAGPLQKRRLFQDVNMLTGDGLVMVFDNDSTQLERVTFLSRTSALAETAETWAVALQQSTTRKPVFNTKAISVKVRYLLYQQQGFWLVNTVEVFPGNEQIPAFSVTPVL